MPDITVYLLVATIVWQGTTTRVVEADRPFYLTMRKCSEAVAKLRNAPAPLVDRLECEPHRFGELMRNAQ